MKRFEEFKKEVKTGNNRKGKRIGLKTFVELWEKYLYDCESETYFLLKTTFPDLVWILKTNKIAQVFFPFRITNDATLLDCNLVKVGQSWMVLLDTSLEDGLSTPLVLKDRKIGETIKDSLAHSDFKSELMGVLG